jgi:hypothetical protein
MSLTSLKALYDRLPDPLAAVASDIAYRVSPGPLVYRDPAQHMGISLARGAVVFSIDFEMAWAWQYARSSDESPSAKGLRERAQVPVILREFESTGIPATWATVGHLFLSSCSRDGKGLAHAGMPRIPHFETRNWVFGSGDWYQHDPCTDVRRDPAWYAPDLVEAILSSRAGHEVGCHTFSHIGCGEAYCSPEVAASEVDACLDAMGKFGVSPVSWVFPGNDDGNCQVLARKGIKFIRTFPVPEAVISLPVQRADGMWGLHSSKSVEARTGSWNLAVRLRRLKSYLEAAIREKMALHVWFHPSLLEVHMQSILFPFLHHCAGLREKGLIDIMTMQGLAENTGRAMDAAGIAPPF